MDSTKPASRSTRRCLDTVGCGMPSCRSISPTDRCDETSRLRIARRFGSAMISNTDSMLCVYSTEHIRVKVYTGRGHPLARSIWNPPRKAAGQLDENPTLHPCGKGFSESSYADLQLYTHGWAGEGKKMCEECLEKC